MSGWDELSEDQKLREAEWNRRHHSSVNRAHRIALEDMREKTIGDCIDWLAAKGFSDAAAALERECFEVAEAS